MRLESGSRLGPYEISGPIGAGGMGEVYRARDTRLGREVAIKVLPQDLTNDRDRLARFEREARSSSALNHRNIVTIHDFTSQDGNAWMVMELIRGESLRDVIGRGPLPPRKALAIATGIAEGLAAAHAAGLVHRDLKPENIMIAADGTPKILDFGLVKESPVPDQTNAPTTPHITRSGVVMGTAGYMSPEQARGENLDFRTDQFSFGLIVYEMLTGNNPFRRATAMDTVAAILHDDPPPLGEPLGWIVERCLQKNRQERYGSTADLAHDLRRIGAAPAAAPRHAQKGMRAAPWILAAALVIVAGVVALKLRRTAGGDLMVVSVATPAIDQVLFGEILPPVTIAPDGRFAAIAGIGNDGIDRLWLYDLRSGATRPIAGSEHAFGVTFSPDSRSIAFSADGKLQTMSVDGGPARELCLITPPGQLSWSGDTILFAIPAGIQRISSSGGAPQQVLAVDPKHPGDVLMWPEFFPDGKHFLYLATNRHGDDLDHALMAGSLDGAPPKSLGTIESRAVFAEGDLLFVREGTLLAQPFDPKALAFSGEARPLVDDIFYFRSTGLAAVSASRNGLLLWRSRRHPSREVWVDRVGSVLGSIGEAAFLGGRLSPEGNSYAAALSDPKEGTGDIWIYDLARQTSERLTFQSTDEEDPVWAPDGKSIFYRSDVLGPPDVFRWNLGEDHGTLVYRGPAIEQPEDVSPDGRNLLILSYNRTVGNRLMVMPIDPPGNPRPFSTTPFNDESPRFSPDGRWVAYDSDASGRPEIYVRPFQGGALPVRISRDGGTKPRWRHDGRELFFAGPRGRVMAVPMNGGAPADTPKLLFQASDVVDFEAAADGLRFLAQLEQQPLDPPVHLMINWPARLKRH